MSGIAGIVRFDGAPPAPGAIEAMTEAMAHRGPDGIAHRVFGSVALGHCMLRTTPESLEETQPLASADDGLLLVIDGRLDNRQELEAELKAAGARLRTRSDAGLVLAAYARWGRGSARRLVGDFAFAVWDGARRRLFCARDQLGARPFFHAPGRHGLAFASEPAALLALPWVSDALNEGMVAELLADRMLSLDETLWTAIRRLPPARALVATASGTESEVYWRPDRVREVRYRSLDDYAAHYRALVEDAVRRQSRSHLPIACEVSGGIDSSGVFGIADHLLGEGRLPAPALEGLTLRLPAGSPGDEIGYARAVGEHHGVTIGEVDACLPPIDWFIDCARRSGSMPYPNGAINFSLYGAVRERGMRTVLTGQGGDQWQNGTPYRYADLIGEGEGRALLHLLAEDSRRDGPGYAARLLVRYGLFPYLPRPAQDLVRRASRRLRRGPPDTAAWLGTRLAGLLEERRARAREATEEAAKPRHGPSLETLDSGRAVHFRETANLLASLAGVETRDPLYSLPIVEFHFATPERTRLHGGRDRATHVAAMRGLVPDLVLDRTDKAEFSQAFRRHLPQFETGGAFALADATPDWVRPEHVAQRLALAREPSARSWPLWGLWGLFGCAVLAGRYSRK